MTTELKVLSEHACFGGRVGFYRHWSEATQCKMNFSVFVPPLEGKKKAPVLTWLSGLTCTEETFMIKAGAQRVAARLGLMLVSPDTSPRSCKLTGEEDDWDFGTGAGFYLDATQIPWIKHYRMYSYVIHDLQEAVFANFPGDRKRQGLFGHSMGGHGALTIGLKHPEIYYSLSAFAPIVAPMEVPWGIKAFTHYLGSHKEVWRQYDASKLMAQVRDAKKRPPLLVDQGLADQFLKIQLKPELLEAAAKESGYPLKIRRRKGFDHGYYFISTFIEDHLKHHAKLIC